MDVVTTIEDSWALRPVGDQQCRLLHRRALEVWMSRRGMPESLLLREEERMRALDARYWAWHADSRAARRLGKGAPMLVFTCGEPRPRGPSVAVVGTRQPDLYGLVVARTLARILSEAGVRVVSGGAIGVDTQVHEAALEGPGGTTCVLAGGLDRIHPLSNRSLFHRVRGHPAGALISEAPILASPVPAAFPRRNRLIAALVDAVVVVQASLPSGALNTAEWAERLGVPVFAVPGDVWFLRTEGCLSLLRRGARPLTTPGDLGAVPGLEALRGLRWPERGRRLAVVPPAWGSSASGAPPFPVLPDQDIVLDGLADGPLSVDALADRLGRPASEVLSLLSVLEIEGRVCRLPGDCWCRR